MKNRNFKMVTAFMLLAVSVAWGLTRMNSLAIWNSTVDNTVIGGTTAAAGHFTTLGATGTLSAAGISATNITATSLTVNGLPGAVSGNNAYVGWGKNGTGDMDFIAANSGSSPSFYWYFLLGSTQTIEMWLDQSAVLHVPDGIDGNVTGNLTGNGSGTWTGNVTGNVSGSSGSSTGNSATASAFNHTPTGCATANVAIGIAANGNLTCSVIQYARTTSVNFTGSPALSTANTTVPLLSSMPDTNYAVSCSMINATGFPYIYNVIKSTGSVQVAYSNGTSSQAVASGAAEIDCTVTGS